MNNFKPKQDAKTREQSEQRRQQKFEPVYQDIVKINTIIAFVLLNRHNPETKTEISRMVHILKDPMHALMTKVLQDDRNILLNLRISSLNFLKPQQREQPQETKP